jgi:hypothetical protein
MKYMPTIATIISECQLFVKKASEKDKPLIYNHLILLPLKIIEMIDAVKNNTKRASASPVLALCMTIYLGEIVRTSPAISDATPPYMYFVNIVIIRIVKSAAVADDNLIPSGLNPAIL